MENKNRRRGAESLQFLATTATSNFQKNGKREAVLRKNDRNFFKSKRT